MKRELRKKYLEIRRNIIDKKDKDFMIYSKVVNNKMVINSRDILIYVSKKDEVDTIKLIEYFLGNKRVAVPKIVNKEIVFYYINKMDDLKIGYFDILEPITDEPVIDFSKAVSITPGICFSKDLFRLGYGGGFYDKFLDEHNIYSIGLCYKECFLDHIPVEEYDKPVNEVITN